MINTEQIAHYVTNPSSIKESDISAIKSLAEKNPACTVYSLLYLTAISTYQSVLLDEELPKHAYKHSDRICLYHALQSKELTTESVLVNEEIEETPIHLPNVITQDVEEHIEELTPQEELKSVDTEKEKSIYDFELVAETLSQDYLHTTIKEEQAEPNEKIAAPQIEKTEIKTFDSLDSKRSFTAWIASNSNQEAKKETPSASKVDSEELINKFIETNPSLSRPKADFYSPTQKAKESVDENRIPVSETLAKIFAAQGNFPKAIHVYHQLILAFPEKKSLFAVQIEELKKKITQ